jgi:hypothetical protein
LRLFYVFPPKKSNKLLFSDKERPGEPPAEAGIWPTETEPDPGDLSSRAKPGGNGSRLPGDRTQDVRPPGQRQKSTRPKAGRGDPGQRPGENRPGKPGGEARRFVRGGWNTPGKADDSEKISITFFFFAKMLLHNLHKIKFSKKKR